MKNFVTDATAKKAREKGFPQWSLELFELSDIMHPPMVLYRDGVLRHFFFNTEPENRAAVVVAKEVMQTWLREKHNIHVYPYPIPVRKGSAYQTQNPADIEYTYNVYVEGIPSIFGADPEYMFESWGEAFDEALLKGLDQIV